MFNLNSCLNLTEKRKYAEKYLIKAWFTRTFDTVIQYLDNKFLLKCGFVISRT